MNLFDLINKPFKELKDLIQKYTIRSIVCEASCHHIIMSLLVFELRENI